MPELPTEAVAAAARAEAAESPTDTAVIRREVTAWVPADEGGA